MPWYNDQELAQLRLGAGEVFFGEAALGVTKALFQSGVAYVGGYQGSPAANLMDTVAAAEDLRAELGVHFQANSSEGAAAAMLGASINFPLRGAVIYKATAGSAVATDALANLASTGVTGGALILIGGDYGEKGNTGQERTIASAMKSTMWLLEPRPEVAIYVDMVEKAFELSEASNAPVMLEMRLRGMHATGEFVCKDNRRVDVPRELIERRGNDPARLVLPPATYDHERHKVEHRLPAARAFIREHGLNEHFDGRFDDVGIIAVGALYNSVAAGLRELGLATIFGEADIPILALNVTYPLVPDQIEEFCRGKRAVLVLEESHPNYLEQAIDSILRKADIATTVIGKDILPRFGQYTEAVVLKGLAAFIEGSVPAGLDAAAVAARMAALASDMEGAAKSIDVQPPARESTFCTGCPERPVFSAFKLAEHEFGPVHVSADIGCHGFATMAPFNMGNTILGYGLGLASSSAVGHAFGKRVVSIMGDGGFWHNGLLTGVANAVYNEDDSVLLVFDNGYTASTGGQQIPSSANGKAPRMDIEAALRSVGVSWIRNLRSYGVAKVMRALREAMTTAQGGLKVIVAEGECQLAKQQRTHAEVRERVAAGERTVRTRFGIDDDVCTGDHSCIRLSGCPSLTVKANPDPLKKDPVAHVNQGCVGCGLCGEVSHAAVLCPSFYRAEIVQNPGRWDRLAAGVQQRLIAWLQVDRGMDAGAATP